MLAALGFNDLDQLIAGAVPASIRDLDPPADAQPHTEHEALAAVRALADQNQPVKSMIGMGYHNTVLPPVIQRNILENPGWYTAYTPYQPEVAQGRLEALLNFQQLIVDLTAMPLANASLLDEATAAAEAMTMLRRVSKSKSNTFAVADDCHPQTIAVLQTRANPLGINVIIVDPHTDPDLPDAFGLLIQNPGTTGCVRDLTDLIDRAHRRDTLVAVAADPLSLVLIKPPGEMDVDVVIGSSQRFGVPMGFGGPHAAFFATRETFARQVPGRVIGVSVDRHGRPALRMALQTREQHIRREKATSNICTAQVLLAILAGMVAVYHGPTGLRRIAGRVHRLTTICAAGLEQLNLSLQHDAYFDTLAVHVPSAHDTINAGARAGFNLRHINPTTVGITFDQTTDESDVESLWQIFNPEQAPLPRIDDLLAATPTAVPSNLMRTSAILEHPVFHSHHSETEMMRYLRRLEQRDIALNRSMIPSAHAP